MLSFGKKRLLGNAYEITVQIPKVALEDHYIKVHRIYDYNDTARMTKIDYRMKLPQNPVYVKRVVNYPDGHSAEIFTVTSEVMIPFFFQLLKLILNNDSYSKINHYNFRIRDITENSMLVLTLMTHLH